MNEMKTLFEKYLRSGYEDFCDFKTYKYYIRIRRRKMKVIDSYRRSARVTEEINDTRAIAHHLSATTSLQEYSAINRALAEACKDLPITYIIRLQIKVLFFWITIWSESCDISDGDTRAFIKKRADNLFNLLEGKL